MEKIRGKVIILGDDVDTDQILPGYAMSEPYEEIGKYAMAGLPTEDFKLNREPGCILVAGRNFGCGSSREQAPIALKQAQVALVVKLHTGEIIEVDLEKGTITAPCGVIEANPLSENVLKTLEYGGLIPRVRAELGITE